MINNRPCFRMASRWFIEEVPGIRQDTFKREGIECCLISPL